MSSETTQPQAILHVCTRETIRELRDRILRLEGYHVFSTFSLTEAGRLAVESSFNLVLIDVEGEDNVPAAEKLCSDIKEAVPDQKIAYICNHHVSILTECPDEVIHAEFNPRIMVEGVRHILNHD